jgi:hypothetical protein
MPTITDEAGNKYLGDCIWANHDINYPTTNFLKSSVTRSTMSSEFNQYLIDSGLRYRNPPGSLWNSSDNFAFTFGANTGDTIDDRYIFRYFGLNAANPGNTGTGSRLYNNGGYIGTNSDSSTNAIVTNTVNNPVNNFTATRYECEFSCVSTNNSLGIIFFQAEKGTSNIWWHFNYAGILLNVNTNFSYYNSEPITRSFLLSTSYVGNASLTLSSQHYIASAAKAILQTGRAAYTISCSDGQTPGSQWATDMWVYDNNSTLGFPVIGRVPNMLLGVGTYTYLKPVKIQGSVFPDNGSPWYLPVGNFAGKVLLMRCYSSVA